MLLDKCMHMPPQFSTVEIPRFTSIDKLSLPLVSQSYDASTHFETTVKDVLSLYNKITGKVISQRHKENHKFSVLKCFC